MVCARLDVTDGFSSENFSSRVAVRGGGSIHEIIDQKRGQTQLSLAGELLAKFRVPVARHTIHFMYAAVQPLDVEAATPAAEKSSSRRRRGVLVWGLAAAAWCVAGVGLYRVAASVQRPERNVRAVGAR